MAVMFFLNLCDFTTLIVANVLGWETSCGVLVSTMLVEYFHLLPKLNRHHFMNLSVVLWLYLLCPTAMVQNVNIKMIKGIVVLVTVCAVYVPMSYLLRIVIGDVDLYAHNALFGSPLRWLYSYICIYVSVSIYSKAARSNIIQRLSREDSIFNLRQCLRGCK